MENITVLLDEILTPFPGILSPLLCRLFYDDNQGNIIADHAGGTAVKIYLFNPETRVYLGEDFADDASMKRGVYVVPSDATTVAPPEGGRVHLLVFDVEAQCWEVWSRLGQDV